MIITFVLLFAIAFNIVRADEMQVSLPHGISLVTRRDPTRR